jgi:carboxylate-amine ligase
MRREPPRTLGVEEEFHLVDLKTRRLTTRGPELLRELSDDYVAELQRCVVEINTGVVDTLDGLQADLLRRRRVLVESASELGIGVVAAGSVPLSVPTEMQVTQTARYRQMHGELMHRPDGDAFNGLAHAMRRRRRSRKLAP